MNGAIGGIGQTPAAWNPSQLGAPGKVGDGSPFETGRAGGVGGANAPADFGKVLNSFVEGVNDTQKAAEIESRKVLMGESTNLHQAMLAGEESGIALRLMVEVRNKLVEGFQEVMRMQV